MTEFSERGLYHYPNLTDLGTLRRDAIQISKKEPVTLHFHPYSDKGCTYGVIQRGEEKRFYDDLPMHERYVDGELE